MLKKLLFSLLFLGLTFSAKADYTYNPLLGTGLDYYRDEFTQTTFNDLDWTFPATGTENQAAIHIDDNRTGTTADEALEATIYIDAEGSYAIYVLDGFSRFYDKVYFDNEVYQIATFKQYQDDVQLKFGTGGDIVAWWDSNSTADDLLVLYHATSGTATNSMTLVLTPDNMNGTATFDDNKDWNLVIMADGGADAADTGYVRFGPSGTVDLASTWYFDIQAGVTATDAALDATTTELAPCIRMGGSGSATTDHSLSSGDVLFEDNIEVDAAAYFDAGINIYNGATSAGSVNIYEDTDNGGNYTAISGADSFSNSYELVLPDEVGGVGEVFEIASVDGGTMTLEWDVDDELTEEEVEDFAGGMLGGTETHIAVTYQDASNDIDFVVDPDSVAGAISEGALADASIVDADIKDDVIQEPALNSTNAPTDNYVLSYNQAGTNFTWVAAGGASAELWLLPESAILDDNNPPALTIQESSGTGTSRRRYAAFDPDTDEILYWSFTWQGYSNADVYWMANDTGANEDAIWCIQISATTEADADSMAEDAADTYNSESEDVNATEAYRLIKTTIALSNTDSAATDDFVTLRFWRDADDSSGDADADALTSDALVLGVYLY